MPPGPAFYVYEDRAGEWRWTLVASNHEIVADSGEGYSSHSAATQAMQRVKAFMVNSNLHVHEELPPGY